MDVTVPLIKLVGKPLAAFLLKRFLEDPVERMGLELVDIAASRLTSHAERSQARRVFEGIGEQTLQQLAPLFEEAVRRGDVNVEAVARELGETLAGPLDPGFFLKRDLDSARLARAFREAHPFPRNQFSAAEVSLYERSLDMAVCCLVEVAHQLPRFNQRLAAEQLKRLSRMQDDFERVLDGLGRLEQVLTASAPGNQYARFEASYRQAVSHAVDSMDLFGVDVEPHSRRYQLFVAYISLTLQVETGSRESSTLVPAELLLEQLPLRQGRLLIRGEAGSGKSTLFRWMALMAASSGTLLSRNPGAAQPGGVRDAWYTRIPLLIRLRDCKNGRLPPVSALTQHTSRLLESPPTGWAQSVLEEGRALVLLDGVDEVPLLDRDAVYADLENLIRMYAGCYYVLSTRPAAVQKDRLKPLDFHEASLNPLSALDRDQLIDRWHEAVAKELERAGKPSGEMRTLAEGLKAEMLRNPPIARLATNPLLAAVICAIHQKRQQALPRSQSELCEALCHMLLERREKESQLDGATSSRPYRSLTYSQRKQLVSGLAHHMVLNERSTLEEEAALEQLAKVLETIPGHSRDDAPTVLKELIERSGLLREAGPGRIDFIHNTLKEYLAAYLFARNGDDGLLAKNATEPSWQNVLPFAASDTSGQVGFAEKLITQVLTAADSQVLEKKRQLHVMAIRLQATAQFLSKALQARLESLRSTLFPPKTMDEARALASLGAAVVPLLEYHRDDDEHQAAANVRTLRLIASPEALSHLRGYLEDSRPAVIEELAQAINPLELGAVKMLLLKGESLSEGIRAQISDLMPLTALTEELQSLDVSHTRVSDLTPLAFFTELWRLNLSDTRVSDLTPLASLTRLRWLNLSDTRVSQLTPLAALTALRLLSLKGTRVSDLTPLAALTALQFLDLRGTRVSELTPLAPLTALQALDLGDTQVSDLTSLTALTALQALDLRGTQVSDLTPLAALTALKSLDLRGTPIDRRVMRSLDFESLRRLNRPGLKITTSDADPTSHQSTPEV